MAPRWIDAQAERVPSLAEMKAQRSGMIAQARAEALNTPVKTTKLGDNLYLLQGAGGNLGLQTGAEGNLLIDASFATAASRIREAIGAVSKDAPNLLINTHWHFDHTDGNEALHAAGFTICAHQNTRKRLSTPQVMKAFGVTFPASPAGALPVITFDHDMHLFHNDDAIDLVHVEPAHTDTDIFIHFRKGNVLHTGDLWFNGMYPFIDEGTGGSIGGMIKAGDKLLAVADGNAKIIPGHGELGSKADFQKFHDMLSAIRDKVAALKNAGASEQEAVAKKPTADFDAVWGKGFMSPDVFTGIVYRTI